MDERHFHEIVRRNTEAVWRLCASLLPDIGDAADAVQRTFAAARPLLETAHDQVTERIVVLRVGRDVCLDERRRRAAGAGTRKAG